MKSITIALLTLSAGPLWGQAVIDGALMKTTGSLPASCAAGELFLKTGGDPSRMLYVCSADNTWTQAAYRQGTAAQIPSACVPGQIYFATDTAAGQNLYYCTAANVWTQQQGGASYTFRDGLENTSGTIDWQADPAIFALKDDFPSSRADQQGELYWKITGTATTVASTTAAVAGHPGVRAVTTGAASGNTAGFDLSYNSSGVGTFHALGTDSEFTRGWQTENIVQLDNAAGDNPLANMGYCFALTGGANCPAWANWRGVAIVADTVDPSLTACTWNTANWMYVAYDGAYVCVDSGLAAKSGNWYHLKMVSTTLGSVVFTVNGGNAQTISTHVPTAYSNANFLPMMLGITRTAAAKAAWIDFWSFVGRGLTR